MCDATKQVAFDAGEVFLFLWYQKWCDPLKEIALRYAHGKGHIIATSRVITTGFSTIF